MQGTARTTYITKYRHRSICTMNISPTLIEAFLLNSQCEGTTDDTRPIRGKRARQQRMLEDSPGAKPAKVRRLELKVCFRAQTRIRDA